MLQVRYHEDQRPFQFSIKSCFVVVTIAAALFAANRCANNIVWRIVEPDGMLGYLAVIGFATTYYLAVRSAQELALAALLIAWCFALLGVLIKVIESLDAPRGGSADQAIRAIEILPVYEAVLSGIALPGFLTIPFVYLIFRQGFVPRSRLACWCTVAVTFALMDIVLGVICAVSILGARIMEDGTIYWAYGPY